LMSASTASEDVGTKKRIYEQTFRTRDYFVYEPFNGDSLQGWHLNRHQEYEELTPDERGWLWCESLGLWLGTWEGRLRRENAIWLRFYDRDGNLVLLPEEVAEQEQQRAEQEQQRAEQEQQRAEQEQQRAEQEQQRAEQAEAERDQERQQREQAEANLQQLQERLRQLGIDSDTVS
ncbi:Uma2 family endonuclease, partial [Spirulina sp. CS-785/01]